MEITWYGLSCFRLTERGLATVVTDPFDNRAVGYASLKLKADIVTVSHAAPGHNFEAAVKGYTRRSPVQVNMKLAACLSRASRRTTMRNAALMNRAIHCMCSITTA